METGDQISTEMNDGSTACVCVCECVRVCVFFGGWRWGRRRRLSAEIRRRSPLRFSKGLPNPSLKSHEITNPRLSR